MRADDSPPFALLGAGRAVAAEDAQGSLDVRRGVDLPGKGNERSSSCLFGEIGLGALPREGCVGSKLLQTCVSSTPWAEPTLNQRENMLAYLAAG